MLFEDTVLEPETAILLGRLGAIICESEKGFALVGGTALAIQRGHRKSIDLDFFCPGPFDPDELVQTIRGVVGGSEVSVLAASANTLNLTIAGVMVDLIQYAYQRLEPLVEAGGYQMLSLPDIAAMKLSAVANRGSKKDFFDIDELLKQYQLGEMLEFYKRKFVGNDTFHVVRSLTYFLDAEEEPDPLCLQGQTWDGVKARMVGAIKTL